MFTGIVEEIGTLRTTEPAAGGVRMVFAASLVLEGTGVGDSIAVNGCCLTVVDLGPGWWAAEAVEETLRRTNLSGLAPGDAVNLERALALGARLGGHLVQGHVDAVAAVASPAPAMEVLCPAALARFVVEKGSVTVDGVSLTVAAVRDGAFSVAVIPHTSAATTLGGRRPGDLVNLEADVMAKYAERLLSSGAATPYAAAAPGAAQGTH